MKRLMMFVSLLLAFVMGTWAQRYYVMYYEADGQKHYLAISENGQSLTKETTLSLRCYWVADGDLNTVNAKYNTETLSGANENARKTLRSYKYSNKSLIHDSNEVQGNAKENVFDLKLSTTSESRWLMDNNNLNDTPVLYYWNYKHYVYFEEVSNSWKYCSKKDGQPNVIKIIPCSLLLPPLFKVESGDDGKFQVTISANEGCSIYYAEGDSEFREYSGQIDLEPGATIKAYSKMFNSSSTVATLELPSGLMVKLNDFEDHTWTYYSGVPESVDEGDYNGKCSGKIYSPNPRNVKITYQGGGITLEDGETGSATAAVGIDAPETSFVYEKTLESKLQEGKYVYPYTTIANPFSRRPSKQEGNNPKQFYGFVGWKVKSISGTTITDGNTSYGKDATISAEQEIFFNFTSTYSNNCTSAEVVLEAIWEKATVTYLTNVTGDYTFPKDKGGTYETNFLVLKCNPTSITLNSPCTIMMVEPDGSADYRNSYTYTGTMVPSSTGTTKIEYAHWNPIANIDAKGCNFTIGRGMKMDATASSLYGTGRAASVNQVLKIESGKYNELIHYADGTYSNSLITKQWVMLGCDYDRAKGDNSKLEFAGRMYVGHYCTLNLLSDQEMCRVYGLSGRFMTTVKLGTADWQQCYYMSVSDGYNKGYRYMEIQGGEWLSITGGTDYYDLGNKILNYETGDEKKPSFTLRMKGGHVKGSIYGAAAYYDAVGTRTFVITGGTINGWVAGGANGTQSSGGAMVGASYVYVGGNASIDSKALNNSNPNYVINRAVGGNVFGAGCGYSAVSESGQVTLGTNVVIADDAFVERGVYGGGSYGYTQATSNIYITGGTIDGKVGGVNGTSYDSSIKGGVYGGACQNKGGSVNIYMTGGTVNGGLYGGSNASGTLSGDVTMKITGGKVGESSQKTASVYGGGYGKEATVVGSTDVTMTGGTINGNVFGGGNEGAVTKNSDDTGGNTSGGNTSVTITGGTVTGNVYGGGNQAEVEGQTRVVIGSSGQ